MKILTTSTNAQTLEFIPRAYPSTVKITLRDNSTNASNTIENLTLTQTKDKASISTAFSVSSAPLVESRFYDLSIIQGIGQLWNTFTSNWEAATANWENVISSENTIYKDKIFCTDQTINQADNNYYDINSGEYTQTTAYPDDDYIIIS
jgi:hypothetical protein